MCFRLCTEASVIRSAFQMHTTGFGVPRPTTTTEMDCGATARKVDVAEKSNCACANLSTAGVAMNLVWCVTMVAVSRHLENYQS